MTSRNHLNLFISILIFCSLSFFSYKFIYLELPLLPKAKEKSWQVEAVLSFKAGSGPVQAKFYLPSNQAHYSLLDENMISYNYGVIIKRDQNNRQSLWSIRRAKGPQKLFYKAIIYPHENELSSEPPEYPKGMNFPEAQRVAAENLLNDIRSKSADSETFASALIKELHNKKNGNVTALIPGFASSRKIAHLAVKILAGAHIPARLAHGFLLSQETQHFSKDLDNNEAATKLIRYVQIWNGEKWLTINPKTAELGLPKLFFIWWYGSEPVLSLDGGKSPKVDFAVTTHFRKPIEIAKHKASELNSNLLKLSPIGLPLKTQNVYKALLMVPVGIFVILILRCLVGIATFGTFTPLLVGLSFYEIEYLWGMFLFSSLMLLGFAIRYYFSKLNLMAVPRQSAVLSGVILLMTYVGILSHQIGVDHGLSVALFPIVNITMSIEKMFELWDEKTPGDALLHGVGSLFAASIAYFAMFNTFTEHLFFVFPELLLIVIAGILVIGLITRKTERLM